MSEALILGRTHRGLAPLDVGTRSQEVYAAQLLDEATLEGRRFQHCTFANISFKAAKLSRCEFENCAFIDCYFRHTVFENCKFVGCKFISSSFSEPTFIDNTFRFLEFRGCFIPYEHFRHCFPTDPGLRRSIADELAREASATGDLSDARQFHLVAERAYEQDRWNLAWATGSSYYRKPRPPLTRARAGSRWAGRKFNRLLWGYGEKGLVLGRSFIVVAIFFALVFKIAIASELSHEGGSLSLFEYLLFSFDNLLAGTGFSQIEASGAVARWLSGSEVFVGLMFVGLFVSLVFNWIRRR